jgi:hypothetical protein
MGRGGQLRNQGSWLRLFSLLSSVTGDAQLALLQPTLNLLVRLQAYCTENYLACTQHDPEQRKKYQYQPTYLEVPPAACQYAAARHRECKCINDARNRDVPNLLTFPPLSTCSLPPTTPTPLVVVQAAPITLIFAAPASSAAREAASKVSGPRAGESGRTSCSAAGREARRSWSYFRRCREGMC